MAARPYSAPERPVSPLPGTEEEAALQGVLQRAEAMSIAGLAALEQRAMGYLKAGYPLHLRGPAGSGKTTLALRVASRLKRPIVLLVGDAGFDTRRLVGGEEVTRTRKVVDRYISSVMKVESQTNAIWLNRAVTVACLEGQTLVYDEFNRAPPTANNVLLTVLEERLLVLPKTMRGESYTQVHPEFRGDLHLQPGRPCRHQPGPGRADRPHDHAGSRRLRPRDGTGDRGGALQPQAVEAARIVDIVRDFRSSREYAQRPTLRASIMLAHLAAEQDLRVAADDPRFVQLCLDLLGSKLKPGEDGLPDARQRELLIQLIDHFCVPPPRMGARQPRGVAA